jgi:hypothetical protein
MPAIPSRGVAYQEYHCVYGEDVEAALRFLFAAMAPKAAEDVPFQGIPAMLYMDNGPHLRRERRDAVKRVRRKPRLITSFFQGAQL